MYDIQYSQEVKNYFGDNRVDYRVAGIHADLKILAETIDGLPDDRDSCYHLSDTNRVYWLVEHHFIIYRRDVNRILVSVIKPLD